MYFAVRVISLVLLLVGASVAAQESAIDHELDRLESIRTSSPKDALTGIKALERDRSRLSPRQNERLTLLLVHSLALRGKYEEARSLATGLLYTEPSRLAAIRANELLAAMAEVESDYTAAFKFVHDALLLLQSGEVTEQYVSLLLTSANQHFQANDVGKAISLNESALIYAKALSLPRDICIGNQQLSYVLLTEHRYREAKGIFDKAEKACDEANEPLFAWTVRSAKVRMMLMEGEFEAARALSEEVHQYFDSIDYRWGEVTSRLDIAEAMRLTGDIAGARIMYRKVIPDAVKVNAWDELVEQLPAAIELERALDNLGTALEYADILLMAKAEVYNSNKAIQLAFLQSQFSVRHREHRTALAEKERQLAEAKRLESEARARYLTVGLLTALIGVLLLSLLAFFYRKANRKLDHLAHRDGLTGLFNRRYAFREAQNMLQACRQRGEPFCVVMADIDLFKSVNDQYGHLLGDQVLQTVAQNLAAALRKDELLCRSGGEEFALFLANMNLDEAKAVVERCRTQLQSIAVEGVPIRITLSFGIALCRRNIVFERLLEQADEALYTAKHRGRDCVVVYSPDENQTGKADEDELVLSSPS